MLGYYMFRAKENVYSKLNKKNRYHLLYKKNEYYVGTVQGSSIRIYDELDNSAEFHWFGCMPCHPDYSHHFELVEQAMVHDGKAFYKIRKDLRHPVNKQFRKTYNRVVIHEYKKEPEKKDSFNKMLPDAIRKIVLSELIDKAIKNTPYEKLLKEQGVLCHSRYIADETLKFLVQEFEEITNRHKENNYD